MRAHTKECPTSTTTVPDFVDVTDDVQKVLEDSCIVGGQVSVFSADPGCALIVNERESGLLEDIGRAMGRLGTSPAASRGVIGSSSIVLPATDGKLRLGTWQRVLLVELAEAGPRSVIVQIVGE